MNPITRPIASFRRVLQCLLVGALVFALGACKSVPDPAYTDYLQAQTALAQARAQQVAAIADVSSCAGDTACVIASKLGAVIASNEGGSGGQPVQQYRKQYHPAWGIVGQALPTLAQVALGFRQSDNSRDIALGQYDFLGGVVGSVMASPALLPRDPSITVGGDYVTGAQHIGDAIGRDAIGGDQHVGDWHQGDAIGGDDNSGNSGRIGSPGPYDDNSGQCTGLNCQGGGDYNPPVEPVDPDTGG